MSQWTDLVGQVKYLEQRCKDLQASHDRLNKNISEAHDSLLKHFGLSPRWVSSHWEFTSKQDKPSAS